MARDLINDAKVSQDVIDVVETWLLRDDDFRPAAKLELKRLTQRLRALDSSFTAGVARHVLAASRGPLARVLRTQEKAAPVSKGAPSKSYRRALVHVFRRGTGKLTPDQLAAIELVVGRERGRSLAAVASKWRSFVRSVDLRPLTKTEKTIAQAIRKMRKKLGLATAQRQPRSPVVRRSRSERLLDKFLVQECPPQVRAAIRDAIADLAVLQPRFDFNRFSVVVDRDNATVVVEDHLRAVVPHVQSFPLAELMVALRCADDFL